MITGVTRADFKHCRKMPYAGEELNRSVKEEQIESRHSNKSLCGMETMSHDLGAEIKLRSLMTVDCCTSK